MYDQYPVHPLSNKGQHLGPYRNPLLQPIQQTVVQKSSRIQAILSAGAVKAACELVIAKSEKAVIDSEASCISMIQPLPKMLDRKFKHGWFKTTIEEFEVVPTEAEQEAHRLQMIAQCAAISLMHKPSTLVLNLHALASHFPPDHQMPLEGDYLTAIASALEPYQAC